VYDGRVHRVLLTLLVLSFAIACSEGTDQKAVRSAIQAPPNVVLVVADDMTLDELKFMPKTKAAFPRSFTRYYVTTSSCCPSRATILTGKYAHNHEVYSNAPPDGGWQKFREVGGEQQTLATLLQANGYRTAHFGKYMNGYDCSSVPVGWDHWYALGGDKTVTSGKCDEGTMVPLPRDYDTGLAREAIEFAQGSEPFFAWVSFSSPHYPSLHPPEYDALYSDLRVDRGGSFDEADVSDKSLWVSRQGRLSAAEKDEMDTEYRNRARSLASLDDRMQELLASLPDNTYVIFTSDNGYHIGEHRLRSGKTAPYEEDIHVPLLVKGPGVIQGEAARMALNTDIAPTIAAWAGTAVPQADGRDLAPLLQGEAEPWRSAMLVEKLPVDSAYKYRAVRSGNWLFVRYGNGDTELYDMQADPDQMENLAGQRPNVEGALAARLQDLRTCAEETCRNAE
jgi:arylsulfatase A-like enzyme